jgi:hypothetical protein
MKKNINFVLLIIALMGVSCIASEGLADSTKSTLAAYKQLPKDKLYPKGRIFPFFGYSGDPQREKAENYTVVGPQYSRYDVALEQAEKAGLPCIYTIGIKMNFHKKGGKPTLDISDAEITRRITEQVKRVVHKKSICWWYAYPEEIRYWRSKEINYLKVVTAAIRAADPENRPIWMYEPNSRNAKALEKTSRYLDIIGKGTYVNLSGYQKSRVWVRWSIEQQEKTIKALGKGMSIAVLELCKNSPNEEIAAIPAQVQHDIYLSLMSGAKGVGIWSLFRRAAVSAQYDIFYMSYARAAKQLCGEQQLGQVFLFGKENKSIKLQQINGPKTIRLISSGHKIEPLTSEKEQNFKYPLYPALSTKEIDYDGGKYLFICNSAEKSLEVRASFGISKSNAELVNLLNFRKYKTSSSGSLKLRLRPYEVVCLKVK